MATTSAGNPYVESSDLVANYPATSLALANRLDKYAVNPFADAAARDAAIPTPVQGQLAQTLDDNKVWRYDGTAWAPFSGAVSAANFTDTATGNYTDGTGQAWKYLTFTGTGSITIDQAGFADILIVGGGASGASGYGAGGGAGAFVNIENAYLSVATHTIVVGAGGAAKAIIYLGGSQFGSNGNASRIADYFSPGGGAGAASQDTPVAFQAIDGLSGASGGGASAANSAAATGGSGIVGFGGDGGNMVSGITNAAAGGGGGNPSVLGRGETPSLTNYGGAGGAGTTSSITNAVVDLCGGGGGSGGSSGGAGGSGIGGVGSTGATGGAGTGSTGSGGGGSYSYAAGSIGGNGGSGTVTIRVKV